MIIINSVPDIKFAIIIIIMQCAKHKIHYY